MFFSYYTNEVFENQLSDRLRILKPCVFDFEDYSFCNDYCNNYLLVVNQNKNAINKLKESRKVYILR